MDIKVRLNKNFQTAYNRMAELYGEEMAYLNGFGDKQLSYTDFIDNFIDKDTVADASVDGNSNVGNKDMRTLMNEMPKPHRKLLAFNKIYYEMNKRYGFKAANEWLEKEWTKALYMHDADTSTYVHYCFAYDLKDVAEKGLFFLNNFNAEPPKHLSTFVDFVKEYISFAANRSSGAVGLPNLIPYMYYFWKKDCETGYATKSPDYYARQQIQRFVYAVNQPYVPDGMQSAFTNCSVYDMKYLEALFAGSQFPDGSFMIDDLKKIQEFQKVFMETIAEIRQHNMFTFPVLTISLLRKDGKFADEEFARWGIEHNRIWSDSNLFIDDSVNSLSNCCRLKSNIEDLGYFNSIGGTALKVGSVKVSTVNLARLALEYAGDEDLYLAALRDLVELDCQALDCVRHIIERNVEKGLLPNFTKGIVDFEHLYNTVGIIGIYETMKTFGYTREDELGNVYYTEKADAFGKRIFEMIHATKDAFAADKDYKINIEQSPGESATAKMQIADEFFYPNEVVKDLPLYGNQFIPLGIKTTMVERIRIASLFDSYCNGGSIAHLNIDAPFDNFEKAWEAVNYIADQGLTYFAFNTKIQACAKNHAFYGTKCPICGGDVATEYTRIVGFYTPIKSWSKERKAEFKLRQWEHINGTETDL